MSTWSFCDADGIFTGARYTGPDRTLPDNTPAGCTPVEGSHDHNCRRVDMASGAIVPWQPPAPPDTALATWAWDAGTERWISQPTQAARAASARAERDRRLAACDWVTARALDLGQPVPAAWAAYRAALRDITQQIDFPGGVSWPVAPKD